MNDASDWRAHAPAQDPGRTGRAAAARILDCAGDRPLGKALAISLVDGRPVVERADRIEMCLPDVEREIQRAIAREKGRRAPAGQGHLHKALAAPRAPRNQPRRTTAPKPAPAAAQSSSQASKPVTIAKPKLRPLSPWEGPTGGLGFYDRRDRLAGDIRTERVAPDVDAMFDHAHRHYDLSADETAEFIGRFLASVPRDLSRRKVTA